MEILNEVNRAGSLVGRCCGPRFLGSMRPIDAAWLRANKAGKRGRGGNRG